MHGPLIRGAKTIRRYRLGRYIVGLLDEIESAGVVQYRYILAVAKPGEGEALYVTSEVNRLADVLGGGSHFLGMFSQTGHSNLGASDEWADLERFTAEALWVAAEHLGVAEAPQRLPDDPAQ